MFDSIITKCVKPESVTWLSPDFMELDIGDGNGIQRYELLKGAQNYIHSQINLKVSTSKDLYKKSQSIWSELIKLQLDNLLKSEKPTNVFSLEKDTVIYLVTDSKCIVDIIDLQTKEALQDFIDKHKHYILDITTMEKTRKFFGDGKSGINKLICYDKNIDVVQEDYVPIVILELNYIKSKYKVYTGIYMYKNFTFLPSISCDMEEDYLSDFIKRIDLDNELSYALDKSANLYDSYEMFLEHPVEISARELTALLKKVGYKLELEGEDKLHPIENLVDEQNNQKIQDFYNTFISTTGETALQILQLNELKKTFRYNKITLVDVLSILSKEYLEYEGDKITADVLGDVVFKLYDSKNADKVQVESIKKEVK